MDLLELRLLGPPEIALKRAPLALPSTKAQALVYYLAVTGRAHQRSHLAGLLWGGLPEDSARRNLRGALNQLRPALRRHLLTNRQIAGLNPSAPISLDVAAFEMGTRASSLNERRAALSLYRGDFLHGFEVRDAPEFDDWVTVARERLRQRLLDARQALAEAAEASGELADAIADVRAILAMEAWREEAHRQLMRLLARAGRRSEALGQFEACRRLLAEGLGVGPAPATVAVYEAIRDGSLGERAPATPAMVNSHSPLAKRPPPHNLPAETTPFVGRQAELAQAAALLAEPGCRLLTLFGPGGIGKTRLALQAARQLQSGFADGVWLIPLEAIPSPELMMTAIASALRVPLTGRAEAESLVLAFLRERQALLVLDNFEHLTAAGGALVGLLEAAADVKLLVTSREALNLYEETLMAVEGLAAGEAAELFVRRARRVHLGFDVDANQAAVAEICALLQGMPLGIELAAAWARTLPSAEIARELRANLRRLTTTLRNVPERHRSLLAAFEHSWALLTPEQQGCVRRLAVFHGGFTPADARAVAHASRRDLSTLAGKALVTLSAAGRYDLHPLVRQFAAEKLAEQPGERADSQARHTAHYAQWLAQRAAAVTGPTQQLTLDEIAADLDNVRAAWATAAEGRQAEHLDAMAEALFHFYSKRGLHQEGSDQFGRAVAAMRATGAGRLLARLLVRQGRLSEYVSREAAAPAQLLTEGLALARANDLPGETAQALMGLGLQALMRGEAGAASQHLEESLALCQQANLPGTQANVLTLLAWVRNGAGEREPAQALAREAIALHRTTGDRVGVAAALTALGKVQADAGQLEPAEEAYAEALEICRQTGHQVGLGQALTGLFSVCLRRGAYDRAAPYAHETLAVTRAAGDRLGMAIALHNLGDLAAQTGQHREAVLHLQDALDLYRRIEAEETRQNKTRTLLAASLQALGAPAPVNER